MCSPSGVADADPGVPAEVAAAGAHDRPQEAAVGERMRVARAVELGPLREEADLGRQVRPAVAAVAGRRRGDVPAGHRLRAAEREVDEDPAEHQLDVVVGDAGEAAHREAEPARVGVERRAAPPTSRRRRPSEVTTRAAWLRRSTPITCEKHISSRPVDSIRTMLAADRRPGGASANSVRASMTSSGPPVRAWGWGRPSDPLRCRCEWSEQDARDALVPAAGDGRLVVDGHVEVDRQVEIRLRSRRGRRRRGSRRHVRRGCSRSGASHARRHARDRRGSTSQVLRRRARCGSPRASRASSGTGSRTRRGRSARRRVTVHVGGRVEGGRVTRDHGRRGEDRRRDGARRRGRPAA